MSMPFDQLELNLSRKMAWLILSDMLVCFLFFLQKKSIYFAKDLQIK